MPPEMTQKLFAWSFVGYTPSPEQLAAHQDTSRMKLVAGGERAGKSMSAAMELFTDLIGTAGLWWIVGPDYEQARHEFDYIKEALQEIGAIKRISYPTVGQCTIDTVFGGHIITKSSDDVRKLAGAAPNGILLCEAAQCDFGVWMKLRGRLTETRGWLWASGTFEGSLGWYPELWKRWQAENPEGGRSFSIPTWANRAIFPLGREDPEILALEATYPHDLFLERCAAVPCPPTGLVFREFSYEHHVASLARYDPARPVEIAIDPGYASAYVVLAVQWLDKHVWVVDEVYESGWVAEQIIQACEHRPWWARLRGGVIDVAGKQHPGQKSQVEIWRQEAGVHLRANRVTIVDGIARLRTFLVDPATGQPLIGFNPALRNTLEEFQKYRYAKDSENRPISELPIDRDNHALKALSYWLYDRYGAVYRRERLPDPGQNPFGESRDPVVANDFEIVRGTRPGQVRIVRRPLAPPTTLTFEECDA